MTIVVQNGRVWYVVYGVAYTRREDALEALRDRD